MTTASKIIGLLGSISESHQPINEAIAINWKGGGDHKLKQWLDMVSKKYQSLTGDYVREDVFKIGGEYQFVLVFEKVVLGVVGYDVEGKSGKVTHAARIKEMASKNGRWKLTHDNKLSATSGVVIDPIPDDVKSFKQLAEYLEENDGIEDGSKFDTDGDKKSSPANSPTTTYKTEKYVEMMKNAYLYGTMGNAPGVLSMNFVVNNMSAFDANGFDPKALKAAKEEMKKFIESNPIKKPEGTKTTAAKIDDLLSRKRDPSEVGEELVKEINARYFDQNVDSSLYANYYDAYKKVQIVFDITDRRNTSVGVFRDNQSLIKKLNGQMTEIKNAQEALGRKCEIRLCTEKSAEEADMFREQDNGSAYTEYEVGVGGSLEIYLR